MNGASVESSLSLVSNILITYYVTKVHGKIYKVNVAGLVNKLKKLKGIKKLSTNFYKTS